MVLDVSQADVEAKSYHRSAPQIPVPTPSNSEMVVSALRFLVHASGYIEFDAIQKHVDTEDLTFQLVTDNQGKRILFLVDASGEKQYKTIFINSQNTLEIVDVTGGTSVPRGDLKVEQKNNTTLKRLQGRVCRLYFMAWPPLNTCVIVS